MKEAASPGQTVAVRCPHCKKDFEGALIADDVGRYRGFKCPHCRLFVPEERTQAESA